MTDIRVYGVSPIPVRDRLVVIVLWDTPNERRTFCEVFIISSDAPGPIVGQRFSLPTDALCGRTGSTPKIFLEKEATQWAIHKIEDELLAWTRRQAEGTPFPPNVHLQSAGEHALRGLWIGGRLRTWIDQLQNATLSETLKEELRQLREIPTVE